MNLRTKETFNRYKTFRENQKTGKHSSSCLLCQKISKETNLNFVHWKILFNDFPYDNIADTHDLLVPIRHFSDESEMTETEKEELLDIKTRILPHLKIYDTMLENFREWRTVDHFHVHLLKIKDQN